MNPSAIFITRPVTTILLMLGHPGVRHAGLSAAAGQRPAGHRLPDHSGERLAARRQPRHGRASSIALPLEKQFATIAGLQSINSTSAQGSTNITLQFDLSRNIDAAAQDVQAMIAKAARQLPPQMPAPPSYQKVNPGDQPVMFLVLRSPTLPLSHASTNTRRRPSRSASRWSAAWRRCRSSARRATPCASISIRGSWRPTASASTRSPASISNANANLPTGTIYGEDKTFTVLANGKLLRAAAYGPTIIAYRNGNPVRLDEVAHVYDGVENDKTAGWYQRRPRGVPRHSEAARHQRRRGGRRGPGSCCRRSANSCRPSITLDVRSDRAGPIRESVRDVKLTLLLDGRARRPGHLPVPAQHLGDDHPQPRAARLDRRRPSR